jgi:hypothetical protein
MPQQQSGNGNAPDQFTLSEPQEPAIVTAGSFAPAREERAHEPPIPNSESQPQWSFAPETPSVAPRSPEREAPFMRTEPARTHAEVPSVPRAEPLPEAPEPTEKKGGWWQRRFKSGS